MHAYAPHRMKAGELGAERPGSGTVIAAGRKERESVQCMGV